MTCEDWVDIKFLLRNSLPCFRLLIVFSIVQMVTTRRNSDDDVPNFEAMITAARATHSIISTTFAKKLNMNPTPLIERIIISTPMKNHMLIDHEYVNCPLRFDDRIRPANLLPIHMFDFDVILGMDCPVKLISAMKARTLISHGCQGFLASVMDTSLESPNIENLSVVREFADVFPDELPGLPPAREIEFGIELIPGAEPILKPVFKNKRDERSIVMKNKARLVAQGFSQEKGIDYDEVFAPVARIETIRLFLAFASYMGFTVYQMDVKSSFLYGIIKEEVYVHQPLSFVDPAHLNKVYKVIKALYGLHQAPRAWYETLSSYHRQNIVYQEEKE
ncbi:putative reverse transcriptase domain-containing protein [Tanacetum coccineum]